MTFSSDMQEAALSILSDLGQSLTFSRYTNSEYNPASGAVERVSSTTYTGYGNPSQYNLKDIDGEIVQQNDINLILYCTSEPNLDDEVTLDSDIYHIINIQKMNAQGSTIVYRLQLRK